MKIFTVEWGSWLKFQRQISALDSSFMAVTKRRQKIHNKSHGELESKDLKTKQMPIVRELQ